MRDADGEPTGVLMERGARLRVNEAVTFENGEATGELPGKLVRAGR